MLFCKVERYLTHYFSYYMMPLNEGDPVVIWIDPKRAYISKLERGKRLDTDKGVIFYDNLIGLEYGSSLTLQTGAKAYLLKPTIQDLYSKGLKRPSQVLYPKDIGYILTTLSLNQVKTVIEAGTGSGFLTISLALSLSENAKIYTYDVREDMQKVAKFNANVLGVQDKIVFKLKDIREGIDEKEADAIFLDMPDPWNAIPKLYEPLKPSSTIIVFVPTVNQIEKTFFAMKNSGIIDIHVEELILREYQVKENAVRPRNIGIMHTGFIIRGRKSI
ncbi:tRNA (adenine-N1)-methyltransferase [Saccharolobus islandicus]|uniref:tRNA (adenine-N1)-methyltransferase n=1 Tax=Saccharolobus islandicus TaxID=43080 RepID=UPI00064F0569|nr:tRNA (adenine-N1)-methyltransferase [Sulfolobus islandicus]